jgi:hypothetical protein
MGLHGLLQGSLYLFFSVYISAGTTLPFTFYPREPSPGSVPGRLLACDVWVVSGRRMPLRWMSPFPGWHHPPSYVTGSLQMWTHTHIRHIMVNQSFVFIGFTLLTFYYFFMLARSRDSSVSIVIRPRGAWFQNRGLIPGTGRGFSTSQADWLSGPNVLLVWTVEPISVFFHQPFCLNILGSCT